MKVHLLGEEVTRCINCGKDSFKVSFFIYKTPYFGDILLEVGLCSNCGYRRSDVSIINFGAPKRIVAKVVKESDLNALVVKASSARIFIPELGIEVKPGPAASGYITTIEGVLERVLDNIPSECFNEDSPCFKRVLEIKRAIKGEIAFTLIIEDPLGRSDIKGEKIEVKEEPLY
ncbi:MAG: hypothetical protein B6U73_04965 [Desulfurococcales archaeon ex4484_204]|nr:MAG: hypothetical protein B6U73_04965 [Desulfurococcales archaeon ex4484_204]